FRATLLLVGVYTLIDGIMMAFLVSSMPSLEQDIREGTLDNILLKPINPQLYYFFHSIDFTQFLNALLGLAVIIYASRGYSFSLAQIGLFVISCLAGGTLYYSLWFLWTISAFWFPTNFGRSDLFLSMVQIGRYPASIFRGAGSILFNFLLPFGMVATPASVVLL
ncbi:multidrug transporter, partial [Lactobacillus sp. XV13L]|nr:multidrug transporter [Lactobacillus sp. XV13L]